jgi:hypothetical protein
MPTRRALTGVAHDIAQHSASGLSYISPHLAQVLRDAGLTATQIELLDASPYPPGAPDLKPLRLALKTLHSTVEGILQKNEFALSDVTSVQLHVTPDPSDPLGYLLQTRILIGPRSLNELAPPAEFAAGTQSQLQTSVS